MAIASVHRRAAGPVAHRIERRNRKRSLRGQAGMLARTAAWAAGFLLLGWLVAAGFYGLLVNV
ncbi:MAG TPA: hypothetical protein VGD57_04875 [Candidatus Dormibacteraeota bacterium]